MNQLSCRLIIIAAMAGEGYSSRGKINLRLQKSFLIAFGGEQNLFSDSTSRN
jgi:hypothetical protein